MTTKYFHIVTPDREICCKAFLPDAEPDLVVLGVHGFAGDKESSVLTRLGKELCRNRGALVCFDFPAHGESAAPDSQLRVENCRADLLKVASFIRTQFPGRRYGIFATSFGGYTALLCADQLRDFRMVLRAPAVTMASTFTDVIIPCTKEEFLARGGARCGFDRKMFVSADFYRDLLENPPVIPDVPLLILHGDRDDVVPFEAVKKIAETCENVELIPFPGADHRFKGEGESLRIAALATAYFLDR